MVYQCTMVSWNQTLTVEFNDSPLSEVNTSGSDEDSMKLLKKMYMMTELTE